MPAFTQRLFTRGYEMDHRGYIPPAVLARYLEHVRWKALAASETGLQWALSEGRKLVVRAQRVELGIRVVEDTELELRLTLGHVGRTSMRFFQQAVRAEDGSIACSAELTAVLLGADDRPTQVPEAARAAVQAVPAVEAPAAEEKSPTGPPWVRDVEIRPSDLDTLQHVNQSRYLEMFDDTRQLAARGGGYGPASERALQPVRSMAVDYRRETRVGHPVQVRTWALETHGHYDFELLDVQDTQLLARGRVVTG